MPTSRDNLLHAATRLFAARGYTDVSTKEIALQAGVSETHLFRLFGTKSRLYEEVVDAVLSHGIQTVSEYSFDDVDFRKAVIGFADHAYAYLKSHPELERLIFFTALTDPKLLQKVLKPHRQLAHALGRRIRQAQDAGLVRRDKSALALARGFVAAVFYPYLNHELLRVSMLVDETETSYKTNVEVWLDGVLI
jgi:AcrR family transcriptional regulator